MGTVYLPIDVASARLKSTATPELVNIAGTNFPVGGYAFDAAAREDIYFQLVIPLLGAAATDIAVSYRWYSRAGSTTGAVTWGLAFCRMPTASSVEAASFLTASTTANTVNSTAKGVSTLTISGNTITSIAANDLIELNIYRDGAAGGDTMAGDAVLMGLYLSYSDV